MLKMQQQSDFSQLQKTIESAGHDTSAYFLPHIGITTKDKRRNKEEYADLQVSEFCIILRQRNPKPLWGSLTFSTEKYI